MVAKEISSQRTQYYQSLPSVKSIASTMKSLWITKGEGKKRWKLLRNTPRVLAQWFVPKDLAYMLGALPPVPCSIFVLFFSPTPRGGPIARHLYVTVGCSERYSLRELGPV